MKEYKICDICQKRMATDEHHLLGGSTRKLCDIDSIVLDVCRDCHNQLHNTTAMNLSKMLGQALWELEYMSEMNSDNSVSARRDFMKRYGKSWL